MDEIRIPTGINIGIKLKAKAKHERIIMREIFFNSLIMVENKSPSIFLKAAWIDV